MTTTIAADRHEARRVARIVEESGFPYECRTPAQTVSSIATAGSKTAVVITIEDRGKSRVFVGYHDAAEAPALVASMRRKRSIRVTSAVALGAPLAQA